MLSRYDTCANVTEIRGIVAEKRDALLFGCFWTRVRLGYIAIRRAAVRTIVLLAGWPAADVGGRR